MDNKITRCRRPKNLATTWDNLDYVLDFSDIKKYVGFIYCIEEVDTGMKYYGIKKFWKKIRRKPLKGKKRVRIDYVESDWMTYKTSSPIMQNKLNENRNNYICVVLTLCNSVTEMKATEAYYQLKAYIEGDWDKLYNEVINLRLRIPKSKK